MLSYLLFPFALWLLWAVQPPKISLLPLLWEFVSQTWEKLFQPYQPIMVIHLLTLSPTIPHPLLTTTWQDHNPVFSSQTQRECSKIHSKIPSRAFIFHPCGVFQTSTWYPTPGVTHEFSPGWCFILPSKYRYTQQEPYGPYLNPHQSHCGDPQCKKSVFLYNSCFPDTVTKNISSGIKDNNPPSVSTPPWFTIFTRLSYLLP